jgi:protein arginine kinase
MSQKNNSNSILSLKGPWDTNENSIWIASTVQLNRNLEKFKFPNKLDGDRRKQLITLASKELLAVFELTNPFIIKAEEIGFSEKEFLAEHFLASQSFNQASLGEAFVLDSTGQFIVTLNLENHLQFQILDSQGNLENSWSRLVKIETQIGNAFSYSYSQKFGFLTADPAHCGTGLLLSIFLQLSALIHTNKIDETINKLAEEFIGITGIQGNPTDIVGDILVIHNNHTLGISEENILSTTRSFVTKLLAEENKTRQMLKNSESADIKDKVSRAFGILVHSYQIEAVEALNAISLLKLGVDLGWFTGTSHQELNRLFFNCRRGHLVQHYEGTLNQEEIPHKRAEFIHKTLKNIQSVI